MEAADGSENHYVEIFNGCEEIHLGDYMLATCRDGCEMAAPGVFDGNGAPHGSLRIGFPQGRQLPHKGMFVIACARPRPAPRCPAPLHKRCLQPLDGGNSRAEQIAWCN